MTAQHANGHDSAQSTMRDIHSSSPQDDSNANFHASTTSSSTPTELGPRKRNGSTTGSSRSSKEDSTRKVQNQPSTPLSTEKKRSMSWSEMASMTFQVSLHDWVLIATMIFGGCCSNVFALEILVADAPKSGQMITFAQFFFVSLYGLSQHMEWPLARSLWPFKRNSTSKTITSSGSGAAAEKKSEKEPKEDDGVWWHLPHLQKRKIPIHRWLAIVILFFAVSVLNNWALAFKISVPLHIIFRSGGLMVGMILGMILMKKRYSAPQILAVVIVTVGVIYATMNAKANLSKGSSTSKNKEDDVSASDYLIGILMMSVALVVSSLLGLLQETTYRKYGAEWREGLFYSHFLALPMFILFYKDILEQFRVFNLSTPVPALQLVRQLGPYLPTSLAYWLSTITIPRLWIFLAVNTLTQFMCISGVHRLTSLSTALTLNFILNLRKFTSLVISVLYFENGFSFEMVVGSSLVLLGTIMYSLSSTSQPKPLPKPTVEAMTSDKSIPAKKLE